MASHDGHLDATGDREVVYCHACAHEWYRDEHGLNCPQCHGEIIEIVSPEHDPRDLRPHNHSSADTSPELPPLRHPDSDPDEADIEEHIRGENGFVFNSNTRSGARRDHHQPEMGPVLNRFISMFNDFGPPEGPPRDPWRNPPGPRRAPRSPTNTNPLGHHHHHHDDDDDFYHPLHNHTRPQFPSPPQAGRTHVHRTTISNSPFGGGAASVTIYSGPVQFRRRGSQPRPGAEGAAGSDAFQEIFASVIRDMGTPPGQTENRNDPGNAPTFMSSLQEIMGLFNPQNARVGDAVYSQEALDRIISNLMEANPTSNAAPPASEEGLKNLERKAVDKSMLDNQDKTECSICIDDISEGDMALYLPCKHWFHEKCVVLWLKEHNTCPICRTPIETREARQQAREAQLNTPRMNSHNDGSQQPQHHPMMPPNPFPHLGGNRSFSGGAASSGGSAQSRDSHRRAWHSMQHPNHAMDREDALAEHDWRTHDEAHPMLFSTRPPSQRQSRLNEALRSVSAMQERHREGSNEQGSSSGVSYDTSRMQRRNSLSPTSPRTAAPGNFAAHRQRSPSQSSGRWAASDQESTGPQRQSGGSGPLSWLRNRLPGGGSNGGSSRDGRRS